jgi:hypothetical protein
MALENSEQSMPINANTNEGNHWQFGAAHDAWSARPALNEPRQKADHLTRQERQAASQLKGLVLDVRNVHRAEDLSQNPLDGQLNPIEEKARQLVRGLNQEQLQHVATKLDNDSELRKLGLRVAINPKDSHLWIGSLDASATYSPDWSPYTSTDK